MVRIRIAKRRVEAYLMRYIIFYLLKKSNSFLEFFSFYFYITILMLYCQTNIDKMHKLLYIKNKRRLQAMKKFILGFITGGIICATATGFAVEYAVTANPFPVAVNGTETAIEVTISTIIHISNYVTLPTLSAVSMLVSATIQSLLTPIPPHNQHRHRL